MVYLFLNKNDLKFYLNIYGKGKGRNDRCKSNTAWATDLRPSYLKSEGLS